jgi:hypothetical protein
MGKLDHIAKQAALEALAKRQGNIVQEMELIGGTR